ncbi:deoxyguanosinetriphosphate triphosphohydrolase [Neobittarella massiliensis]|uniref:deoxyguanosinetriphosphate triphosphohydrolase n=1 Tax=Neobittarella massiliensis (ex Bilen et al. 2018) TaxID=2041842 RepID=UPI001FB4FC4B|nr:deoxyguanosinetriphosphate triphosphohydrolase [Neobittarella massiliensis]
MTPIDTTIRSRSEQAERQTLSPYAVCAADSRGRRHPTAPCDIRTDFARDRDRILHCKSFRRLKHKTQVFLSPKGDHYRTRLTHTLEVSQIARTVARGLRLNEDLTEAIALGHDLGHTPFGHAGERALNEVCPAGFRHYLQSVRVVDFLEKDGRGLNLTYEVRNGIACHTKGVRAKTLEGQLVRYADRIAYINHDIEDAITAGILQENELPYDSVAVLGRGKNQRITTLVRSLLENSGARIWMGEEVYTAYQRLHQFMFDVVYTDPVAKKEESKAEQLIITLYKHFVSDPDALSPRYQQLADRWGLDRAVCDYLSGMTDDYAVQLFERLYVPQFWHGE